MFSDKQPKVFLSSELVSFSRAWSPKPEAPHAYLFHYLEGPQLMSLFTVPVLKGTVEEDKSDDGCQQAGSDAASLD